MGIRISNLQKRYIGPDGSVVPVVNVPQFEIADGEQVALVGTSGSGKTTLLHLLAGILTPDAGSIVLDMKRVRPRKGFLARNWPYLITAGTTMYFYWLVKKMEQRQNALKPPPPERLSVEVTALGEADRDVFRGTYIGYIFQTHHLLPGFTALENVQLGMSFTGRSADPAWATHLLEEVGLSDRLNYKPAKLSVGQQQRVAVARALANRPKLVLADEPTGALDSKNAQQVLELIRKLCAEVKASLLLVSHDMNIVKQFPRMVDVAEMNKNAQ